MFDIENPERLFQFSFDTLLHPFSGYICNYDYYRYYHPTRCIRKSKSRIVKVIIRDEIERQMHKTAVAVDSSVVREDFPQDFYKLNIVYLLMIESTERVYLV